MCLRSALRFALSVRTGSFARSDVSSAITTKFRCHRFVRDIHLTQQFRSFVIVVVLNAGIQHEVWGEWIHVIVCMV